MSSVVGFLIRRYSYDYCDWRLCFTSTGPSVLVFWVIPFKLLCISRMLEEVFFCYTKLFYLPDIDRDDAYIERVIKTDYGPMRVPTKERALCDYMRYLDVFELSYFVNGLHDYLEEEESPDKLLEVAEHYGVRAKMQK